MTAENTEYQHEFRCGGQKSLASKRLTGASKVKEVLKYFEKKKVCNVFDGFESLHKEGV